MTDPRIAEARRLRKQGLTLREIGNRFGVSTGSVHRWTTPGGLERDRANSRAWKERNRGTCEVCGAATNWETTRCVDHQDRWYGEELHEEAEKRTAKALKLRREGLLNPEIAERLGTTAQAVASLLQRSRVQRFGFTYEPSPYHGPTKDHLERLQEAA